MQAAEHLRRCLSRPLESHPRQAAGEVQGQEQSRGLLFLSTTHSAITPHQYCREGLEALELASVVPCITPELLEEAAAAHSASEVLMRICGFVTNASLPARIGSFGARSARRRRECETRPISVSSLIRVTLFRQRASERERREEEQRMNERSAHRLVMRFFLSSPGWGTR